MWHRGALPAAPSVPSARVKGSPLEQQDVVFLSIEFATRMAALARGEKPASLIDIAVKGEIPYSTVTMWFEARFAEDATISKPSTTTSTHQEPLEST